MSEITIVNWNAAGARFLQLSPAKRVAQRQALTEALEMLATEYSPDVFVLQEVARFGAQAQPTELVEAPPGYSYVSFMAVDTITHRHPKRWDVFRQGDAQWSATDYLGQGYGMLWKKTLRQASVWNNDFREGGPLDAEVVHLDTGLYTGSRDTEPRLAVVAHFMKEPIEFFVVNLHLVTLKGEREGIPARDALGSATRTQQIDVVLQGIVSRYNEWRKSDAPEQIRGRPPLWILSGDLNCIPTSPEIARIQQLNFLDLNPAKGSGTKGQGIPSNPTITVDYIFAGPEYIAFDPHLARRHTQENPQPIVNATTRGISDHFPVVATVRLA